MSMGILINIGADTRDAIAGINRVNKALGDKMSGFDKFKAGVDKAFVPAVAALAGLGAAAYGAAKKAGDLAETQSKVGVIFGDSAKEIEAWAKTAPKALGQTQQAAMDAASTMATFGKAAGLTGKDLTNFSTELVNLSSDMASFYNTDPADAAQAIGAALRGETEPIRKYGVMLNDAALQAEALAMGLVKAEGDTLKIQTAQLAATRAQDAYNKAIKKYGPDSAEAADKAAALEIAQARVGKAMQGVVPKLDASKKALAAQSLIMKQTADAQGDFARTSDGAANQQRILAATVEQLQTDLGKVFLPILQAVTGALRGFAEWASNNQGIVIALAGAIGVIAGAVVVLKAALTAWTVVQWALNSALLANPITWIVLGIMALIAAVVLAYHKFDWFKKIVDTVWAGIKVVIGAVVSWFQETAWPILKKVIDFIVGYFQHLLAVYRVIWDGIWSVAEVVVSWFMETAWPFIKRFVDNNIKAFQALWDFLKTAWDAIYKIVETVVVFFRDLGQNIVEALKEGISKAWGGLTSFVGDKVGGLIDGVKGIFGINSPSRVFISIGGDVVKGFEIGLKGFDKMPKKIKAKMQAAVDAANEAISERLKIAQDAVQQAADDYTSAFDSIRDAVLSAFDMGAILDEMTKEDGNWQAVWDQQVAKAKWMSDVVKTLVAQGASEGLIEMVKSQGAAGAAWGEKIIHDGLIPQMNADLAQIDVWAGEAGTAFADKFYAPGQAAAAKMLAAVKEYVSSQMDALEAMGREMGLAITRGFNSSKPKGTSAMPSGRSLPVGGPVAFMQSRAGAVEGAGYGKSSSSGPVNITIQAGVGDPVAIAKEVRRILNTGSTRVGVVL